MQFITYLWLREDGTPYYVGKGDLERAYEKHLVGTHPSEERILIQEWDSDEQAILAEKFLISFYGRKDNGTGILRNLTDGGEGCRGIKIRESTRTKLREAYFRNIKFIQSRSAGTEKMKATKRARKIRCSPATEFKPGFTPWNKGKKGVQDRPENVRRKISETMKRKGLKPQLWIKQM